ncbi:Probable polygalacturonase non-catalytic subunit JP630 [Striga hermonthica]|uniref:Probable polygalacturonase non-catalytic subunit JP630 n=1 Tax=Striga hermonthica TaxID=68872 RepID=A0A9N7NRY4_STRHE|nr:Probable polygalacturonase non-catalytic subunit JP630 [Striga hermonthica]
MPTTLHLLAFSIFLLHLTITFSWATFSFAQTQLNMWSQNVHNNMPPSISTKLSPLTRHDLDYYTTAMISRNTFKADPKFCMLAGLACSTGGVHVINVDSEVYKTYGNPKVPNEKVDPSLFFRHSALKERNSIRLSNLKESLPHRAFLPAPIASRISLTTTDGVTRIFPDSATYAIETTIAYCNAKNVKGEFKTCPRSLEEMIGFSKTALHTEKLLILTSESTRGSGEKLMIKNIKTFNAENIVACHEMFLPFAAYFCHSLPSTRVYSADLVDGKTGARVNTVVGVCHMDTSGWPADHVAFRVLKFGPGQGEACHWLNEIDLVWVAA